MTSRMELEPRSIMPRLKLSLIFVLLNVDSQQTGLVSTRLSNIVIELLGYIVPICNASYKHFMNQWVYFDKINKDLLEIVRESYNFRQKEYLIVVIMNFYAFVCSLHVRNPLLLRIGKKQFIAN